MRIYCVCGAGIGTSVILARTVERLLAELDLEAEVSAVALPELASREPAQLILATADIADNLEFGSSQLVLIKSITDQAEIKTALARALG